MSARNTSDLITSISAMSHFFHETNSLQSTSLQQQIVKDLLASGLKNIDSKYALRMELLEKKREDPKLSEHELTIVLNEISDLEARIQAEKDEVVVRCNMFTNTQKSQATEALSNMFSRGGDTDTTDFLYHPPWHTDSQTPLLGDGLDNSDISQE